MPLNPYDDDSSHISPCGFCTRHNVTHLFPGPSSRHRFQPRRTQSPEHMAPSLPRSTALPSDAPGRSGCEKDGVKTIRSATSSPYCQVHGKGVVERLPQRRVKQCSKLTLSISLSKPSPVDKLINMRTPLDSLLPLPAPNSRSEPRLRLSQVGPTTFPPTLMHNIHHQLHYALREQRTLFEGRALAS